MVTARHLCLPVLRCEGCGDEMVMFLPHAVCCATCRRLALEVRLRAAERGKLVPASEPSA